MKKVSIFISFPLGVILVIFVSLFYPTVIEGHIHPGLVLFVWNKLRHIITFVLATLAIIVLLVR